MASGSLLGFVQIARVPVDQVSRPEPLPLPCRWLHITPTPPDWSPSMSTPTASPHRTLWQTLMMFLLMAGTCRAQETLPVEQGELMAGSGNCVLCHTGAPGVMMEDGLDVSPVSLWRSSMMANSTRDPLWQAKVRSETLHSPAYAELIESKCTRCHAPQGHVEALHGGATSYGLDEALGDPLASDGVSCTVCHQVEAANLGQADSFSGGFVIGTDHIIRGPYENPLTGPMQMNSGYTPAFGAQMGESELCATCHTLFTPWLDNEGQVGGTFPEQVPYLEWLNSDYPAQDISCQTCHMPETATAQDISTRPPWHVQLREPFYKHEFAGGNAWMSGILRDNTEELGLSAGADEFERTRLLGLAMLGRAALLDLSVVDDRDSLDLALRVTNLSGHKLPTGIPLRRMWLRVLVTTAAGDTLFHSGHWDVAGNPPAPLGDWEPHHRVIRDPARTQIWEGVMGDADDLPTWILLRASHFLKDNRLPPAGFRTDAEGYGDMAIVGDAAQDEDFNRLDGVEGSGADVIHYRLPVPADSVRVQAELVYQSVQPGLQASFVGQESPEIATWLQLAGEADFAPQQIAATTWSGPGRLAPPRVNLRVQGGQVLLEWDPVPGAQDYRVWRLDEPYRPEDRTLLGECTDPSFSLPLAGTRGLYQVTARR
jgi:hypothetical protein